MRPRPKSIAPWATSTSSLARFDEAAKSYRTLVQIKPQYAMGWFNLAVCLERSGRLGRRRAGVPQVAARWRPDTWIRTWGWASAICGRRTPRARCSASSAAWNWTPAHADALFGKAVAMQSLGHLDQAAQIYQSILQKNPDSEESLSNLVLIGMAKQDFDMVREYSEHLLELRPESYRRAGRAGGMGLRGRRACAHREVLHAAGQRGADALRRLVQPGAGASEIGALSTGRRSLRRGAEAAPAILRGAHQSGNRARAAGRFAGARAAYDRAMKANPEALAPLWNLALLLEHSGQIEEAERQYKQVLERAPKEEEARFRMGYLRLQREDYRGAAEAFEGCLKYRPAWPEAHANLALAYADWASAITPSGSTKRCWMRDPKSMDALRGLAALSIQANDFDTALEFHVRLIDLGERSPAVLYNAGLMYEKAGQTRQGRPLLSRRAGAAAGHAGSAAQSGPHSGANGKADEARTCWSKALEAEPALAQGYFGPAID